jgi:hypothetical protein
MPQTSNADMLDGDRLYEGVPFDTKAVDLSSGFQADSVIIPFGRGLAKGSGDRDLLLPVDVNSVFMGIAYAIQLEKRTGYSLDADGLMGYPLRYTVTYARKGVLGVRVTENVTPASPVYWIHTPSGGARKGNFKASATGAILIPAHQAQFTRSGLAGSVVPLSIDLPQF